MSGEDQVESGRPITDLGAVWAPVPESQRWWTSIIRGFFTHTGVLTTILSLPCSAVLCGMHTGSSPRKQEQVGLLVTTTDRDDARV
jgi:hypothetical protein